MSSIKSYVAFLRGINVGGHHKVPMADLRNEFSRLKFENIVTILNSGNIIFDATGSNLGEKISQHLEKTFGFPVPTIIVPAESIKNLLYNNPFSQVKATKDTRHYVSFLQNDPDTVVDIPWNSPEKDFAIIEKRNKIICSVLDLSVTNTPKGMDVLEKIYGKNMTTRNWKTIVRIGKKIP